MAEMTVRVEGGTGGSVTPENIVGATETGIAVLTAEDAAAARTAIGAGTSSLVIGTGAGNAKAGNYAPAWGDVTGKPTTFAPIINTTASGAMAGNTTATGITATAISPGTATNVQGILAELAARITALEP